MTFLAPWAAWFLAGIPVIILLYLMRLKRRPLTVSTLMFWQRVLQESRRRALFQRLRNVLSLLLHLLIFLLIAAALARPVLDRSVRAGSSVVLILDTRARMQAIEPDGESRFEKARRLAATHMSQASGQRQVALMTADASPRVAVPFTHDEKPLREALAALKPTDATGNLEPAIQLADQLLASRKGDRRVIVLSDQSSARDNVAITRFGTRPLLTSPQTSEVLLELRNFGSAAAKGNVELAFDGRLLDVKPFDIEPGGRELDIFPSVPRTVRGARGWLTAKLALDEATAKNDALASDNIAFAVLPTPQPRRVLLVTKGNWFLEKMLDADQQIRPELLTPDAFQLAMADKFDAVIFDNLVPPDFQHGTTPGNFLFIKQSPFAAPDAPVVEQPLVTDMEASHPALRLVNLENVAIIRAAALQLPPSADGWKFQAPLRSFDHPLLITGARRAENEEQRVAALAFDLAESDLPLRVAFPLLASNLIHWLAGEETAAPLALRAGETLALGAEQTAWIDPQTKVDSPAKPEPARLARDFFQPLQSGFYVLNQPAGPAWIAVNTFSEAESDLRRPADSPTPQRSSSPASLAALAARPLWQYLALAALALFALEWHLFHRRRTE